MTKETFINYFKEQDLIYFFKLKINITGMLDDLSNQLYQENDLDKIKSNLELQIQLAKTLYDVTCSTIKFRENIEQFMIKFTEDQLAIIEIIGYTPKLIKDKDGKSILMLDYSTLTKEQVEKVHKIIRGDHHMKAFRKEQDRKLMFGKNDI